MPASLILMPCVRLLTALPFLSRRRARACQARRREAIWLGVLLCLLVPLAHADLALEFTTQGIRQIPVAVLPFAQEDTLPAPVTALVIADLQRSGLFRSVDASGVAPLPTEPRQLKLADLRGRKAEYVLLGSIGRLADGRQEARYFLVDVTTEAVRLSQSIPFSAVQSRAMAHRIADQVYENLTGEKGVFSTRIAYVVKGQGRYQLKVADADAYNEQTVLSSREPIISPRWSPDGRKMAYVTFELKRPSVVVQDLATGDRRTVANFKGNNSAPAWSPDGRQLAVTLSRDGIAQLYVIAADGSGPARRVMSSRAIDTEACFTPDGQSLLFTSDRGGSPQIYKVPVEGGSAQRLTFSGSYNVSPRLSPDGHKLVYVQQSGAAFRVIPKK